MMNFISPLLFIGSIILFLSLVCLILMVVARGLSWWFSLKEFLGLVLRCLLQGTDPRKDMLVTTSFKHLTRVSGKRSNLKWFMAAALVLVGAGFILPLTMSSEARASRFIVHWGEKFRGCHTLRDIQSLPKGERPDLIFVRTFPDGSWVAARSEWSGGGGAGFDATVFCDSTGRIQADRIHLFDGYEGLSGELSEVPATSLAGFYAGLHQCRLEELP